MCSVPLSYLTRTEAGKLSGQQRQRSSGPALGDCTAAGRAMQADGDASAVPGHFLAWGCSYCEACPGTPHGWTSSRNMTGPPAGPGTAPPCSYHRCRCCRCSAIQTSPLPSPQLKLAAMRSVRGVCPPLLCSCCLLCGASGKSSLIAHRGERCGVARWLARQLARRLARWLARWLARVWGGVCWCWRLGV